MDSGNGEFVRYENDQTPKDIAELEKVYGKVCSIFRVGEIVEIKESRFKIKAIGKREMRLRLLPRKDQV
jgi:hypothetical protein